MNHKLGRILRVIAVGLVAVFVIGIVAYNGSLQKRRQLAALEERVEELQTINADLKNQLYELTDGATLGDVAVLMGLVVEKNPQYLHVGTDSLVSL